MEGEGEGESQHQPQQSNRSESLQSPVYVDLPEKKKEGFSDEAGSRFRGLSSSPFEQTVISQPPPCILGDAAYRDRVKSR